MPSVWETRWSAIVAKLAGLRESTALELLPDLMPVLSVGDPTAPEVQHLRGERLWMTGMDRTAAAGQLATLELGFPTNSTEETVSTVSHIIVTSPAVAQVVAFGTVGNNNIVGGSTRVPLQDQRGLGATQLGMTRLIATDQGVTYFGASAAIVWCAAGASVAIPVRKVIGSRRADNFAVQAQTVATRLVVAAFGYERAAGASEF